MNDCEITQKVMEFTVLDDQKFSVVEDTGFQQLLTLLFPFIYCLCSLFLVIVPLYSDTINSLIGVAIALSGVPVYYFCIYLPKGKRPKWFSQINASITKYTQIVCYCCLTDLDVEPEKSAENKTQ